MRDFRGGPVVKNPPSNAGDTSSIPGQGSKILHSTEQLSLCATTRGSLPMSQFFASGGQSIGASASASASVLPMNI